MKTIDKILIASVAIAGITAGSTAYFYRRTMIRSNAKTERTMKMSGVDWAQYFPVMEKRREQMIKHAHNDVWIRSDDGLRLHATYFEGENTKKAVICFHGYTSRGMDDYVGLSEYYLSKGYHMLLPDARAHGKSEGKYIGFGCLDRWDARRWIEWIKDRIGEDAEIILHGTSMGGTTVIMTGALDLPKQVKGIISDCAFTSPKEVFTHVLHTIYHLPAFPMIQIADKVNRINAGYGLDECNAAKEVEKVKGQVLFIHGEKDTFVPVSMCYKIFQNCVAPKKLLIVKGAGHAESYYKDMDKYEAALDEFISTL